MLARLVADRLAERAQPAELGRPADELSGIEVTLRESHIAWASYRDGAAVSMRRLIDFVVPAGIDDPARPSGGNRYDRRVIESLAAMGRVVHEHPIAGPADLGPRCWPACPTGRSWSSTACSARPRPTRWSRRPSGCARRTPPHAVRRGLPGRVRGRAERAALAAASGVVTTSAWARAWVIEHHGLSPERVRVATPGVDPAPVTWGSRPGGRLLCLAAVTRAKGHDILLSALAQVADLDW